MHNNLFSILKDMSCGNRRNSNNPGSVLQVTVVAALLSLFAVWPLHAQTTPEQRLLHADLLEREVKPAQAISELKTLIDSKSLDAAGVGKAWNILGLALEDQGDFVASEHAYEQSVHAFESMPNNIKDYATALDTFGGLYVEMSQFEPAEKLRLKALHLYEEIHDHAGAADVYCDLAGAAFSQKKVNEGRGYLKQVQKEMRLTNSLDNNELAMIASMQGWLAKYDGDFVTSASRYQQALDLWRKGHGEEHLFVGWGYTLLGAAHADAGELPTALAEMKRGIAILERTAGTQNPRYLMAEIAYSRVLDETGSHSEAARIKTDAEHQLSAFYSNQCVSCAVSVAALR